MDGYYLVFERPGLQPFLTYLFDNFNVSIWTAASKDYALFVIYKIILSGNSNRKIDFIFFTYHCDISEDKKKASKSLNVLWDIFKLENFSKNNTLILDDYDEVYETQKSNCIMALPFEFKKEGSENDKFLIYLVPKLRLLKEKFDAGEGLSQSIKKINTENTENKNKEGSIH